MIRKSQFTRWCRRIAANRLARQRACPIPTVSEIQSMRLVSSLTRSGLVISLLSLYAVLCFSQSDVKDEVFLTNGKSVQGIIVAYQQGAYVKLQTDRGDTLVVPQSQIVRVVQNYVPPPRTLLWEGIELTNGKRIEGNILDVVPESHAAVRTLEGDTLVIPYQQYTRIVRVYEDSPEEVTQAPTASAEKNSLFMLFGGLAFPVGDFGSTIRGGSGYAIIGYGFGFQYAHIFKGGATVSFGVSAELNPIDEDRIKSTTGVTIDTSPYTTASGMLGLGFAGSERTAGFIQGLVGVIHSRIPEIDARGPGGSITIPATSSTGFAYGGQIGVVFGRSVSVSVRYIGANLKYTTKVLGEDIEGEQGTSLITGTIGLCFQ